MATMQPQTTMTTNPPSDAMDNANPDNHNLLYGVTAKQYMEPGDTLSVAVNDGSQDKWTAVFSDATVFTPIVKGNMPPHVQGVYKAAKLGDTTVTVTSTTGKKVTFQISVVPDDSKYGN